jgi:hypothetical protein
MIPVFDGHNDVLLHLYRSGRPDAERAFLEGRPGGHLDLAKARAGGFAGGLFAIFVPSDEAGGDGAHVEALMTQASYDIPLPPCLDLTASQRATLHMASLLMRLERVSEGAVRICRSVLRSEMLKPPARSRPCCMWKARKRSTPSFGCSTSSTGRACARSARSGADRTASGTASRSASPPDRTSARA